MNIENCKIYSIENKINCELKILILKINCSVKFAKIAELLCI